MANNNKISTYVLLFLVGLAIFMLLSCSDSFKNTDSEYEKFTEMDQGPNSSSNNQPINSSDASSSSNNQSINSPYASSSDNQAINSPYSSQQINDSYDNNLFESQPINSSDNDNALFNSQDENNLYDYSSSLDNQENNSYDYSSSLDNQGNMSQGNMSQGNMSQGNMSQGNMSQGNMSQGNMSQGNNDPYIPQSLISNIASQSYQNSSNLTPDQQMYSSQKKSSNQGIANFDFAPNDESLYDFNGSSLTDAFAPPIPPGTNTETVDFKKQNMENYNAKDFLPKEINDEWFETDFSLAKYQLNDDKLINTDRYIIGINTVGQSLKNATYDIRGTVPNPKFIVSPWNNSTFEPDFNLKPLC
jgi:hypothetical protein